MLCKSFAQILFIKADDLYIYIIWCSIPYHLSKIILWKFSKSLIELIYKLFGYYITIVYRIHIASQTRFKINTYLVIYITIQMVSSIYNLGWYIVTSEKEFTKLFLENNNGYRNCIKCLHSRSQALKVMCVCLYTYNITYKLYNKWKRRHAQWICLLLF